MMGLGDFARSPIAREPLVQTLRVVAAPAVPVITLARAKLQCKLDDAGRDAEVTDAIEAARAWVQEFIRQPLGAEQTVQYSLSAYYGTGVVLPYVPTEVISVVDVSGPLPQPITVIGRTVTVTAAVAPLTITFKVAGYTDETLPGPVKSAMLLMVADLIRNPQGQVETELFKNPAVERLLWPYREGLGV